MGVVACTRCTKAWPLGTQTCGRCGNALISRERMSLQRVWAFWLMGVICYIPANVLPMLNTKTLFSTHESTIIGGAVELAQDVFNMPKVQAGLESTYKPGITLSGYQEAKVRWLHHKLTEWVGE